MMWWTTSEVPLLVLLVILAHSLVGLVAVWAALGRAHWFVRIAVLGVVLALGLPIGAYDLMLIFAAQSVVVIVPLAVVRYVRARRVQREQDSVQGEGAAARGRLQFSLLDLLLATVVVAGILAFAVHVPGHVLHHWPIVWMHLYPLTPPPEAWLVFALVPAVFGLSTLVAAWAALGARLWSLRLIVLVLIPLSWLTAAWLALLRASGWPRTSTRLRADSSRVDSRETGARSRALRHAAKGGVLLLSFLILLPLATVYYALVAPVPLPQTTLPNPNGYDALVRAGTSLAGVTAPGSGTATAAGGKASGQPRDQALQAARAALSLECRVPVAYAVRDLDPSRWQAIRDLGRAFDAQGAAAKRQGRTADAVRWYVDAVRLARASARGGLIADVTYPIEDSGLEGLCGLRRALTPEQAGKLIFDLKRLDDNREPLDELFARGYLWEEHVVPIWQVKLVNLLRHKTSKRGWEEESLESIVWRQQATMRLLICDLAIRIYRREHGDDPASLGDLVSEHLSAVPQDPFSGKPLVYRRTATGYVLYSVGYNGRDDGGQKPPPNDSFAGDLVLD